MIFVYVFFHRDEGKVKRIRTTKYGANRGPFCWKVGSNISLVWDIQYGEENFKSSVQAAWIQGSFTAIV